MASGRYECDTTESVIGKGVTRPDRKVLLDKMASLSSLIVFLPLLGSLVAGMSYMYTFFF